MMPAPWRSRSDERGTSSASTPEVRGDVVDPGLERRLDAGEGERHPPAAASSPSGANHTSLRPRHGCPRSTTLRASSSRLGVGSAMASRSRPGAPSDARSEPASTASVVAPAAPRPPPGRRRWPRTAGWHRRPRPPSRRRAAGGAGGPSAARARRRGRRPRPARPSCAGGERQGARRARRHALEDDVGVDAAEAEGVDARPARGAVVAPTAGPRPDDLEAAGAEVGVRLVAVQRRRQDPVVHGEGRLDEPGDAGGGHGVADHRLHRAEPDGRRRAGVVVPKTWRSVASSTCRRRGGGAVRLDQADAGRVELGGPPGPLDGEHLPLAGGAHQAGGPAVAGHAGAADHGVDPVAVASASASRLSTTIRCPRRSGCRRPPGRTGGSARWG